MLKNREHHERHFSLVQRHESETNFFARGTWATTSPTLVGIDALRPRLSTILKEHIISQLPELITEIQESTKEAESSLNKLGTARSTLTDQW